MKLESYNDIMAELKKKKRQTHLLLGNGFSMAYDPTIFSYNALHGFINNLDNVLLSKLFKIIDTNNFELVMQQLDTFCELTDAFGSDEFLKDKIKEASIELKENLIKAIEELHPEHVFKIPENKSKACAKFLNSYLENKGNIFTTNYDILLYWILMRNAIPNAIDGFGRPEGSSSLYWGKNKKEQTIHYLHGALPLFDIGLKILKEEYDSSNYIMDKIKKRLENKEYPIFVTAGTSNEKLKHIMHNQYLTNCYENLSNIEGSLITFGFNFGGYDEHIIEAINTAAKNGRKETAKLWSVYIGVYSDEDKKHIESITSKFKCKICLYDASTAPLWNK